MFRSIFLSLFAFTLLIPAASTAWAGCGATTFTPVRKAANDAQYPNAYPTVPATHNALYITDPANQQLAVFDMEWGGTLASLRFSPAGNVLVNGVPNPQAQELVWGHDPGGMLQPAFWVENSNYNPEQAGDLGQPGDWGRGAPVYGGACKNGTLLLIMTSTVEYFKNDPYWGTDMNWARAATVYRGAPRSDMWMTPYAVTLTATFVPNPGGSPAYYLKLEFFWHSTDVLEDFSTLDWGFGVYAPGTSDPAFFNTTTGQWEYNVLGPGSFRYARYSNTDCVDVGCSLQQKLVAGLYPNAQSTQGVAVSVNAATHHSGLLTHLNGQQMDKFWNNNSIGMTAKNWIYAPGSGRRFVAYVLAGDWSQASAFNPQ